MCLCTYVVGGKVYSEGFLNVTKLFKYCDFTHYAFFFTYFHKGLFNMIYSQLSATYIELT